MKALHSYTKQIEAVQAEAAKNEEKHFALKKWIFNMEQEILSLEKKQLEFYDKRNQALDAEIQKTKRLTAIQKDESVYWKEVEKLETHDAFIFSEASKKNISNVLNGLKEIDKYKSSLEHFQDVFKESKIEIPGVLAKSLDYLFKNMDGFKDVIKQLQKNTR